MSRNLVISRVGRRSLHPGWVEGGAHRDWDLLLCPFEEIGPQRDCTVGAVVPGPKWSGIRSLLAEWDGWREYDHVWFPDDDVRADRDTIARMFAVAGTVGLALFAPALRRDSYFAHFDTMENPRFFGRRVGFVEIMVPGFSTAALAELLPTLEMSGTGWGWGLDSAWPKLLDYQDVGIVDGTPVVHTRPVGQMRDAELSRRVHEESDAILARYGCRQVHGTFGGFGPDLAPLPFTPDELLAALVDGWRYLWERDPRVLSWIAAFHAERFPWPEYPTAGTPD